MLQKGTNGKAFNIMASAQFRNIIYAWKLFARFSDEVPIKFARLRQVNSPNSRNKFQICCIDMYLIRFLPIFAVFFVFL